MGNEHRDDTEEIKVEAYAGYKAGETPRKVIIHGKEFPVEYIVYKSRECDTKTKDITDHFRLMLENFGECDILYDKKWDEWKLKNKPVKPFMDIWNETSEH